MYKKTCGRYEFNDYQRVIKETLEQAVNEYNESYEHVGVLDLEELDLRHFLEDESLDADKINKIVSKMREIRLERRQYKAKVSYLYNFIKAIDKMRKDGTLQELLDTSLCNYRDCDYKPRVLSLEELFDSKEGEDCET